MSLAGGLGILTSMPFRVTVTALTIFACTVSPKSTEPVRADMVMASPGLVKELVYEALQRAEKDGRRLVVYVGATWCEPCEVFSEALRAGELPSSLADLRVLKFDNDADEQRLADANYGGQMIPRFVKPRADGTGSSNRFEGSIKGPGAVDNIAPKLEALLGAP